jgi:hypothetical protein
MENKPRLVGHLLVVVTQAMWKGLLRDIAPICWDQMVEEAEY